MNQLNPQFDPDPVTPDSSTGQSDQFKIPGPITQIFSILILLTLIVVGFILGFIILIPLVVLALIIFVYFKIKRFFAKTHDPNGPLDGRRNVRVVERDE